MSVISKQCHKFKFREPFHEKLLRPTQEAGASHQNQFNSLIQFSFHHGGVRSNWIDGAPRSLRQSILHDELLNIQFSTKLLNGEDQRDDVSPSKSQLTFRSTIRGTCIVGSTFSFSGKCSDVFTYQKTKMISVLKAHTCFKQKSFTFTSICIDPLKAVLLFETDTL